MSVTVSSLEAVAEPVRPPRWLRGIWCLATFCVAPFGWFLPLRRFRCVTDDRLNRGLVLILPGIEGRSFFNLAMLHGLLDAQLPYALEIVDWTTGNKFLTLYHLRAWRRNQRVASQLAQRIVDYQQTYPGRPVWIIGHSGGGGMALLTARALPTGHQLSGIVLLAAAVSPIFDVSTALSKTVHGIWSFSSWLDCLFVGLGTTVFGTLDGWHLPAAGMVGFRAKPQAEPGPLPPMTQTAYHPRWAAAFHLGGHFGCVHRVFISEHVAKILQTHTASMEDESVH